MEDTAQNQVMASEKLSFDRFRTAVLRDYQVVCESREASLLGRKEVLTGKAKFGIFGDGKEVPQIAAAKFFKPGDFLSGYYRDQTFAFATEQATLKQFFAQLYADPDPEHEPHSGGRQMNSHFATRLVNPDGEWRALTDQKNIAAGLAPTAAQMPRSLGLALASKFFRNISELKSFSHLSNKGNEVCFCTIGDASTSEGHFWETINAAGVMQIPLAIFVWDDGYGISVPKKLQTTKGSISEALRGMQKRENTNGIDIYKLKAWDYAGMCEVLDVAIQRIRDTHIPALFHVEEVTQPQGHSTSGSHERYKSQERLEWEREWDCNRKMREWLLANALADEEELSNIEAAAKELAKQSRQQAWDEFVAPIRKQVERTAEVLDELIVSGADINGTIAALKKDLLANREPHRKDVLKVLYNAIIAAENSPAVTTVSDYYEELKLNGHAQYGSHLYDESEKSPLHVKGT